MACEKNAGYKTTFIAAGGFMFLIVISGILNVELYEHRNNGYSFLKILPLNNETVILSKIIPPLALTVLLVIYNSVLFSYFTTEAAYLEMSRTYIYICGLVCLLLLHLIYYGVFQYGPSSIIRLGIILFMIVLMGGPIAVREFVFRGRELDVDALLEFSRAIEWSYVLAVFVPVYVILTWILIALTRRKRGLAIK